MTEEINNIEIAEEKSHDIHVEGEKVEPTKDLSSMPATRDAAARKYITSKSRYTSKRINQSSAKLTAIKKRERRLRKIGWSLLFFK